MAAGAAEVAETVAANVVAAVVSGETLTAEDA